MALDSPEGGQEKGKSSYVYTAEEVKPILDTLGRIQAHVSSHSQIQRTTSPGIDSIPVQRGQVGSTNDVRYEVLTDASGTAYDIKAGYDPDTGELLEFNFLSETPDETITNRLFKNISPEGWQGTESHLGSKLPDAVSSETLLENTQQAANTYFTLLQAK